MDKSATKISFIFLHLTRHKLLRKNKHSVSQTQIEILIRKNIC